MPKQTNGLFRQLSPGISFGMVLFFLLCCHKSIFSQTVNDVYPLGLTESVQMALERNAEIRRARIDVGISEQQIRETTAIGLPQLNAALGYQYYIDVPTSLVPAEFFGGQPGEFAEIQFGTEQNLFATATVNQIIFSGEYIIGLRAARIYRELASQGLRRTELDVERAVRETYLLAQLAGAQLELVKKNLDNMQNTLFETEQMFRAGFTDALSVDQISLSVKNVENTITGLQRQYEASKNLLKYQIGMEVDQSILLTDNLESLFLAMTVDMGMVESFDPKQHIDYRMLLTQESFNQMVLRREQSFFLPSLTASFIRQEMAMRNEFNFLDSGFPWFPSTYFGVNLEIPIFSSGMRSARVQQARLELEKSKIATHQREQSLKVQLLQARSDFDSAMEQYINQQQNLEIASRILLQTSIRHKEGLASSLELTQANTQFLDTQGGYLNTKFELLNARNQLDRALGR